MSEQETWTSSIRMLTGLPGTVSYEVIGTDPSDRNQIFAAESQSEAKRLAEFLNDLHGALRDVVELNDNLLKRDEERTQAIAERDTELTRLREYKALADEMAT